MLHQLNNRQSASQAFSLSKAELGALPSTCRKYQIALQPGQPNMVNLPQIGTVPVTLTRPYGLLAWEATDRSIEKYRINAQWIYPASQKR